MQVTECIKKPTPDGMHISLTGTQGDQGVITVVGDADNSLSMHRGQFGSRGCINHAAGGGGGGHWAADYRANRAPYHPACPRHTTTFSRQTPIRRQPARKHITPLSPAPTIANGPPVR